MAPKWSGKPFDELEQGIERIRRLTQCIAEAHDLVAANTQLLRRDREQMRSGPLHDARDLQTHTSQATSPRDSGRVSRRRGRRVPRR